MQQNRRRIGIHIGKRRSGGIKMERLTMREPFWLGEEFWTSAM